MRILTWLQATSDQLHIGNYFGAIKPILELAEKFKDAEIFLQWIFCLSNRNLKQGIVKSDVLDNLWFYLKAHSETTLFRFHLAPTKPQNKINKGLNHLKTTFSCQPNA